MKYYAFSPIHHCTRSQMLCISATTLRNTKRKTPEPLLPSTQGSQHWSGQGTRGETHTHCKRGKDEHTHRWRLKAARNTGSNS